MRRFEQIPEEFSRFAEKKETKKETPESERQERPAVRHDNPVSYEEMLKESEGPTVEFKEIEPEFSAEKALEKPGFFEFLNRRAPQPESLDKKEMETFYDAFNATREIKNF